MRKLYLSIAALALAVNPIAYAIDPGTVAVIAAGGYLAYSTLNGNLSGTGFGDVPEDFNTEAGKDFCDARSRKGAWLQWGGIAYDLTLGVLLRNPETLYLNKKCEKYWN